LEGRTPVHTAAMTCAAANNATTMTLEPITSVRRNKKNEAIDALEALFKKK